MKGGKHGEENQSYQSESGQWDGRQVDGRSLGDVNEAGFQHGDGAQHVDPPVRGTEQDGNKKKKTKQEKITYCCSVGSRPA